MGRLVLTLGVLLVAAAPASAQTTAPPGNAAIQEYLETVPGASGGETVDRARPETADRSIRPQAQRRLEALGPEGVAAARSLVASAPRKRGSEAHESIDGGRGGASSGRSRAPRESTASHSAASAAFTAATGGAGGGMGPALPALMLLMTAAAISSLFVRKARR